MEGVLFLYKEYPRHPFCMDREVSLRHLYLWEWRSLILLPGISKTPFFMDGGVLFLSRGYIRHPYLYEWRSLILLQGVPKTPIFFMDGGVLLLCRGYPRHSYFVDEGVLYLCRRYLRHPFLWIERSYCSAGESRDIPFFGGGMEGFYQPAGGGQSAYCKPQRICYHLFFSIILL